MIEKPKQGDKDTPQDKVVRNIRIGLGIARSEPPRTRTWNLEIKSLLLCQLS